MLGRALMGCAECFLVERVRLLELRRLGLGIQKRRVLLVVNLLWVLVLVKTWLLLEVVVVSVTI